VLSKDDDREDKGAGQAKMPGKKETQDKNPLAVLLACLRQTSVSLFLAFGHFPLTEDIPTSSFYSPLSFFFPSLSSSRFFD
jgi:hypothetical protein